VIVSFQENPADPGAKDYG